MQLILLWKMEKMFSFSDHDRFCYYVQGAERSGWPAKPGTKCLEELLQKLEQHYSPRPAEIVQCFNFHTCFRKPGEAIAAFIARLHSLSEHYFWRFFGGHDS